MKVQITLLSNTAKVPEYEHDGDSGFDLRADIKEALLLRSGERATIPTGLCVACPVGTEIQIRPRSGLAHKRGITVLNTPGTIDAPYRGEIGVILINLGDSHVLINPGDRIAQGVLVPVLKAEFELVDSLPETVRGYGGFGHTGVR